MTAMSSAPTIYSQSTCDHAWAAGFFDGEGSSFTAARRGMEISLGQKTPDLLLDFRDIVGCGRIVNTKRGHYLLVISGINQIVHVARLLWPYLGAQKRDQFLRGFARYKARGHEQHHRFVRAGGEELF